MTRHVPGARIRTAMEDETRAIVIQSYSTQWPVESRKLGTTPRRALGEAIEDRPERKAIVSSADSMAIQRARNGASSGHLPGVLEFLVTP
jgi:hypothetical protein